MGTSRCSVTEIHAQEVGIGLLVQERGIVRSGTVVRSTGGLRVGQPAADGRARNSRAANDLARGHPSSGKGKNVVHLTLGSHFAIMDNNSDDSVRPA